MNFYATPSSGRISAGNFQESKQKKSFCRQGMFCWFTFLWNGFSALLIKHYNFYAICLALIWLILVFFFPLFLELCRFLIYLISSAMEWSTLENLSDHWACSTQMHQQPIKSHVRNDFKLLIFTIYTFLTSSKKGHY